MKTKHIFISLEIRCGVYEFTSHAARTKREAKLKERIDMLNHKLRLLKQNTQRTTIK